MSSQLESLFAEVKPRSDGPDLLVEEEGRLKRLASDGNEQNDFGRVGPIECPIAYDPKMETAFRYVCQSGVFVKDFSQLRAFSMRSGESIVLWDMPLNQWLLWFLEWVGSAKGPGGQLVGLIATDRPVDGQVVIDHRLFAMRPGGDRPGFRPLCRDAYKPLAFSRKRKEVAFSGAEGTYIVGMGGERRATLNTDQLSVAHGGSFDPSQQPRLALGGKGIHIWNYETGECVRLSRHGRYPVWSPDGQSLWYATSSGALHRHDLDSGSDAVLLALHPNRFPDFWKARPVIFSRCGRYVAAMLTMKRLKGVTRKAGGIEAQERLFVEDNRFCIIDLECSEFWQIQGRYFSAFRWL